MSPAAKSPSAGAPAFSPRVILALVLVGLVAFSGLAVLSAYAPELRGGLDGGAHALSRSAVGFNGAVVMLKAEAAPVVVSRAPPKRAVAGGALVVLTPEIATRAKNLKPFAGARTLIVLPKWVTVGEPLHPGFVRKVGIFDQGKSAAELLGDYAPASVVDHRAGVTRPVLRGGGAMFASGTYLPLAGVDRLQTISGEGWAPSLVDEQGRMVLAQSKSHPDVTVLADPDLLNTQGLAQLDNARAGLAILDTLRRGEGVLFDVTLNGFKRGLGLGRMMLEPPWLAATLCGVAAGLLMGLHALARFGPTRSAGRAFALGKAALVDNSAGLVRMARKEHELAPAYVELTKGLVARAAGGRARRGEDPDRRLAALARLRGAADPAELAAEAMRAANRDDLLALGRRLYRWRLEIMRER